MKFALPRLAIVAVTMLSMGAGAASADELFVTIQGQKQGPLPGDASRGNRIAVIGFQYEVIAPRDVASGQATGKRQHKPLVITKEIGPATPGLFQALVTGENVTSVTLEFFRTARSTAPYHRIKLTNAAIVGINQSSGDINGKAGTGQSLESVSFVFQKIEIENGGTIAIDDWSTGAN